MFIQLISLESTKSGKPQAAEINFQWPDIVEHMEHPSNHSEAGVSVNDTIYSMWAIFSFQRYYPECSLHFGSFCLAAPATSKIDAKA